MNKRFLLALAFCIPSLAFAHEAPSRERILEFLRLANMEQSLNASLDVMTQQMLPGMPPEEKQGFRCLMNRVMGWESMQADYVQAAQELYTREELDAYIAFLKTPLGAAINAKNEQLLRRLSELMASRFANLVAGDVSKEMTLCQAPSKPSR